MAETKIEWTAGADGSKGFTFNPWVGCEKQSPACDHCYAEGWAKRTGQPELWTGDRRRTTAAYWQQPIKWNHEAEAAGIRRKVFCASLADVFDADVPERWRDDLWHRIDQTPHLTWLLLTKRPQNISRMLPNPDTGVPAWGAGGWPHVWLGATTENQPEFDKRWPDLSAIPAAVRFLSYEPALGPLRLPHWPLPDWIICGGESGPHAREMDLAWARDLRDACATDGVPYFFKQMTRKAPIPPDLMVRQFPRQADAR